MATYKANYGRGLKALTSKQMLQRIPIALENLLNEIRQIMYSLYGQRKLNNTMNSIKLENRMDTIFINSENSKTSDSHRLLLNLTDKVNQKRSGKYVALSNLSIYYI